jgi:ribonuclease BN (tRNA processing enzyme)
MIIETIFEDGTSYAQTYRHSTENEALQHAWQIALMRGKRIKLIHVL